MTIPSTSGRNTQPDGEGERPYDAGSRKDVTQARQTAKLIEGRKGAVIAQLAASEDGRAWLYDLLDFCGLFADSFSPSGSTSFYNEGKRAVALYLFEQINRGNKHTFVQMQIDRETVAGT